MYLAKGETAKAIASFEVVHKKYPENYETLKVLASLYAHTGKRDKAIHHFRRITETHPKDTEAWVELGDLVERQKNYTEALKAYEKATGLLQAQGEPVPIELWNNVGVLRHQLGNIEGAEQAYRLALAESGATEETFKALDITTLYNLGRLYEAQHKYRDLSHPPHAVWRSRGHRGADGIAGPAHVNLLGRSRQPICTKRSSRSTPTTWTVT
jgi:RNA polymerase-associated protein CTR9